MTRIRRVSSVQSAGQSATAAEDRTVLPPGGDENNEEGAEREAEVEEAYEGEDGAGEDVSIRGNDPMGGSGAARSGDDGSVDSGGDGGAIDGRAAGDGGGGGAVAGGGRPSASHEQYYSSPSGPRHRKSTRGSIGQHQQQQQQQCHMHGPISGNLRRHSFVDLRSSRRKATSRRTAANGEAASGEAAEAADHGTGSGTSGSSSSCSSSCSDDDSYDEQMEKRETTISRRARAAAVPVQQAGGGAGEGGAHVARRPPRHSSLDNIATNRASRHHHQQQYQQQLLYPPIDAYGNPLTSRHNGRLLSSDEDLYDPIRRKSVGGSYGLAAAAFASARNANVGADCRSAEGSFGENQEDGQQPRRRRVGRRQTAPIPSTVDIGGGGGSRSLLPGVMPDVVGDVRSGGSAHGTANAAARAGEGSILESDEGDYYLEEINDSNDLEDIERQLLIRHTGDSDLEEANCASDSALAGSEGDAVSVLSAPGATSSDGGGGDGDGGGAAAANAVTLWERGQQCSGKNLPKRPSQTRLDVLGDLGRPYVGTKSSMDIAEGTNKNATRDADAGNQAQEEDEEEEGRHYQQERPVEYTVPLDVPTGMPPPPSPPPPSSAGPHRPSERRMSNFRRWSNDTEGSFPDLCHTSNSGAAVRSARVVLSKSASMPYLPSTVMTHDGAAAAATTEAASSSRQDLVHDMRGMSVKSRTSSVGSGSTTASTVQAGATTASAPVKGISSAPVVNRRASDGGTTTAQMTIPEASPIVVPASHFSMSPAPTSTSPAAGTSVYLPDVGIVSVSEASARGIMQGRHLAVLDLTTGRHFMDHRSRSISHVPSSYSRPSIGHRRRSMRLGGRAASSSGSSSSRSFRTSSIGFTHSSSTFDSGRKLSLDTRKSSLSHSRRSMGNASSVSINSVMSVFDRDKTGEADGSYNLCGDLHESTGLAGSYMHQGSDIVSEEQDESSMGAVSTNSPQNDNDNDHLTVYSDPSTMLNRSDGGSGGNALVSDTGAPLPILEEFSLNEPDISLDDDVRGPYQRRRASASAGSGSDPNHAYDTGGATFGSIGDSASTSYGGLDHSEIVEERLNPRSLRYLPQILRESYACPNASVRQRAAMVSTNSVEKAGAAAAAAIELRMRLRRPRALPECRDIRGSVLILDLSGFTALGERLKKEHGDSEGAAEFAHRVDAILSTMVEHVYECGGDVLMFAGDALICLFEERPLESPAADTEGRTKRSTKDTKEARKNATTSRVRRCCIRVFGSSDLEGKDFTIHGGSAHGVVHCYFLGRPSTKPGDCTFVVSGAPLRSAGRSLNKAGRGEILVEGMVEPITQELAVAQMKKPLRKRGSLIRNESLPNFARRTSWKLTAEALEDWSLDDDETVDELIMNHDVHPFAKAYLGTLAARRSDHAQDGMSILLNELRPVAIVFVGLHGLTNVDARDAVLLRKMNGVFVSLSRITHSCDGAVKEMSFDDKGCVFISVFGAHSHGANPCFDATMCAMRMQDALKKLELHNFSVGVSFGDCFCGEVGPEIRADYVVMGTEVNTAARLMGKAPKEGILVSKRIFTNSKKYISFVKSEKIKVKGIDEPFHAYIPQDRIVQANVVDDTKKDAQPFVLMPSRQIDMKTMSGAVDGVLRGRPKTILVCGGPFLGKSRMIRELNTRATEEDFTVLQSFRTSLDCFTSYFPFRQITLTALKKCTARVAKNADESESETEVEAMEKLLSHKILTKTDRMMIGSIIPSVSDAQLISLLPKNPKTMTKAIVDSFVKVLQPLQPAMLVFEGDGEIDPSSWSLIAELMLRSAKQCPKLMLVISSRNAPAVPSAMTSTLSDDIIHVKLAPFEKYETEIYLKVLLGIREKGIDIDEKMLDAVHHRANGCPQFIEYIVRWALDKNLIEYVEGHNSMSFKSLDAHSEDEIIPRELSSIVLAAFNDLSPILWDALKIASCIGYSFDANVYEALTGDLDFIPKIKKLATSYDAFEKCDGNRYKWKHQAVYEAVKSLLINSQRQKIHSMIVEVFERNVNKDHLGEVGKGDVHRLLARHCSLAKKWGSAFNQYMEAGKRAEETYNFTEATRMYEEALSTQEKMTPKPLLRSRLLPTVKLGSCLRELARYEEAEAVLTQCLTEAERAMEEIDGDEQMYVHVLTSLATLYQNESKYSDAKKLYEKALPIARNIQESRSSLWLAGQIAGYAEILRKSGDLPSAEALHREALDIRNLAAEEGSCTELELAISFTQLGCTLFGLKRYSEAYSKHRMALYSRFKYLDFSHGLVSESLNYCAESLCSLDRGCEGIPLAMHAVKIRKVVFGTSHPAYAHALSVLASCYYAAGRSCDARDFLDECIDICESAFPKNHANMIPNLMNYGKVLRSTGDLRKARDVFERAITIHQINFKEGQRAAELDKCTSEVSEINALIAREANEQAEAKRSQSEMVLSNSGNALCMDVYSSGAPIIVVTDVGRDVDDEYCLVLMSALKRMHLLNPIAVISTLAPEGKRACLARGILDSLALPNVPVGIGSSGGVAEGVELEVYEADYARPCSCLVEDGVELLVEALKTSPDRSVQVLIIAAFTDVATVMREQEAIFVQKVKEVVIMGGLKPMDETTGYVEADSAYNNNCDMDAANYVYKRCQDLRIPTLTISRYAAYGCPIKVSVLEDLCLTEHMVAHNIKGVSVNSINSLWKKVNYPTTDPRREKLPARCDRTWFCRTFFNTDDVDKHADESIWPLLENLNMYDPLALMACVPAYREANFLWDTNYVNGTPHRIAGVSESQNGIVDATGMSDEMASLFGMAFRNALQNIC